MGIRHRPAVVETRQDFGHWEGDLMIFSREHGPANLTSLVERTSRFTMLLQNQSGNPKQCSGGSGTGSHPCPAPPARASRSTGVLNLWLGPRSQSLSHRGAFSLIRARRGEKETNK